MRTQDELNDELRLAVEGYARIAGGEWEEIEEEDAVRLVEWFLREGADPNAKDAYGYTPLHLAANLEVARLLLEKGADPSAGAYSTYKNRLNLTEATNGKHKSAGRTGLPLADPAA